MAGADRRAFLAALACVAAPTLSRAENHWPDYPGPSGHVLAAGDADIVLQAYPLTEAAEVATYFGAPTSTLGLAPICLHVANQATTKTFLLDGGKINVVRDNSGLTVVERNRPSVSTAGPTSLEAASSVIAIGTDAAVFAGGAAAGLAAPVALPLLFLGNDAMVHQGAIRRNLISKQIYSRTIGPGQSAAGFVYVRFKKDFLSFVGYRLEASLTQVPAAPEAIAKIYAVALSTA